ncbi:MAG TPA: hypothetical protein VMV19_18205 [Xanthobacteraceae bacterium]|nr:hypothetical protein [Xanthobacteraceae bacterium]
MSLYDTRGRFKLLDSIPEDWDDAKRANYAALAKAHVELEAADAAAIAADKLIAKCKTDLVDAQAALTKVRPKITRIDLAKAFIKDSRAGLI